MQRPQNHWPASSLPSAVMPPSGCQNTPEEGALGVPWPYLNEGGGFHLQVEGAQRCQCLPLPQPPPQQPHLCSVFRAGWPAASLRGIRGGGRCWGEPGGSPQFTCSPFPRFPSFRRVAPQALPRGGSGQERAEGGETRPMNTGSGCGMELPADLGPTRAPLWSEGASARRGVPQLGISFFWGGGGISKMKKALRGLLSTPGVYPPGPRKPGGCRVCGCLRASAAARGPA